MVANGQVEEEQKYGNDNADAAADNGATVSEKLTYAMARHYSFRHYFYRKLMVRIQRMIVELRKEDREMRRTLKKKEDPFATGVVETMLIPQMDYVDHNEAEQVAMNEVGDQRTNSEQQRR